MNSEILNELFSFERISDVKAKPGLYAWYLRIRVGRSNIESPQNFSKALKKITEQIRHPILAMQLDGHFNLNMKGKLKHIWYGHNEHPFTENFQEMLNHPEERKLISNILDLAVPLLSGPLYIGVSKNLQQRLQIHTRLIEKYSKEQQEDNTPEVSVDSTDSLQNDKDFAKRIVEREIDPNHLIAGVTYVYHPNLSPDRIRKTIETTETLLNRIFYPILGKK
jgi:hypothetical protein